MFKIFLIKSIMFSHKLKRMYTCQMICLKIELLHLSHALVLVKLTCLHMFVCNVYACVLWLTCELSRVYYPKYVLVTTTQSIVVKTVKSLIFLLFADIFFS